MGIRFPCAAEVRRVIGGASGKSAKRRQRRMKRAGFEEVPRLAATTVGGNRLARRWAVAAPYDPNGGRCGGGYGCPCCGAQNFRAALRRPLKILTAATRSSRFLCHRQRSIRSPHQCAHRFAMTILGSAVHVGGGTHGCRPTGDNREYGASGGVEPRPYA